ncbi:MAG: hypothetical protein RG741_10910 [Bacteroidales bacterium]|nr:hypothetical protein [Bacteroidales bacterium]
MNHQQLQNSTGRQQRCLKNKVSKDSRNKHILLFLLIMKVALLPLSANAQEPEQIAGAYLEKLELIIDYRNRFEAVHPFVSHLYPVAIAEDGFFYVFDLTDDGSSFALKLWEPTPMEVPVGTRAAFTLDFFQNKCAAVVTGDVFDEAAGYITIFHEFIHCHQWHTVEPELRSELPLAARMQEGQNFMWEINYEFPYDDRRFVALYTDFITALDQGQDEKVMTLRKELFAILSAYDRQYMVWQEWKEGYALYIENLLRKEAGLPVNTVGRKTPFNRTVFYAGGEALIAHLVSQKPELNTDLRALFEFIYSH